LLRETVKDMLIGGFLFKDLDHRILTKQLMLDAKEENEYN